MPIDVYRVYVESMNKISAEESLTALKISSYPHLDKAEAREEVYNSFSDQLEKKQEAEVSTLDLVRILNHGR